MKPAGAAHASDSTRLGAITRAAQLPQQALFTAAVETRDGRPERLLQLGLQATLFVLAADTLTSPGWPVAPVVVILLSEIPALVVESTELKATAPAPATATPTRPPPIATEAAAAMTLIV